MDTSTAGFRWAARAGLILGPIGWALNQQFTANFTEDRCEAVSSTFVLASGIVCGLIAAAGIAFSFAAFRSAERSPPPTPGTTARFTAMMGAGGAALFLLVIIMGTSAGMMLPSCYR